MFWDMVADLEPRARTVLRLRYLEGLSTEEIARSIGVKANTVSKVYSEVQIVKSIRNQRNFQYFTKSREESASEGWHC